MDKTMVELFAGVGGLRLGMERLQSDWKTVWFCQREPGKQKQWAHDCYVSHFGDCVDLDGRSDRTGADVTTMPKEKIPDHVLLLASTPCQEFSVAHSLSTSKGIEGKKGELWWQVYQTLKAKRPAFYLMENVDRMLKSPAKQRGRDFGIMLSSLASLGYDAEWRVVNAADYGGAQRRRRTFLFAYRKDTIYGKQMISNPEAVFLTDGFMAKAFPMAETGKMTEVDLPATTQEVFDTFSFAFLKAGWMKDGHVWSADGLEKKEPFVPLKAVLERNVDTKYEIAEEKLSKWEYLKGAKKIPRTSKNGHTYLYSEGPVAFPEDLEKPARTMLTSEATLNRSTHVVRDLDSGRLRYLTPKEAERLQGFEDDWTNTGMPERMRYFCMGNALVVPMVTRMGKVLDAIVEKE